MKRSLALIVFLMLAVSLAKISAGEKSIKLEYANDAGEEKQDNYAQFIMRESSRLVKKERPHGGDIREELLRQLGVADLIENRGQSVMTAIVMRETELHDRIERKLLFQGPTSALEATLFLPRALKKAPAVLAVHGAGFGPQSLIDNVAQKMADRGMVVLVPELVSSRDRQREFEDAFNLLVLGRTLTGVRVFELICLVDYLCALPEVDQNRLIALGRREGSLLATHLASVDKRIDGLAIDTRIARDVYLDSSSELLISGIFGMTNRHEFLKNLPMAVIVYDGRVDEVINWLTEFDKPGRESLSEQSGMRISGFYEQLFDQAFKRPRPTPGSVPEMFGLFQKGMFHVDRKQWNQAIDQFEEALKLSPNNTRICEELARIYENAREYEKSEGMLLKLGDIDPEREKTFYNLAQFYVRRGQFEKARNQLLSIIEINPVNIAARKRLAFIYRVLGKWELAIQQYEEVLRTKEDEIDALFLCARAYEVINRWERAVANYNQIIRLDPENQEARFGLAGAYSAGGDWEAASAAYQKIVEDQPKNDAAHLELAGVYRHQMKWQEAEKEYKTILQEGGPKHLQARLGLAEALRHQSRWWEAEAIYIDVLTRTPELSEARWSLIRLYETMDAWDKAKENYSELIRFYPDDAEAQLAYGKLLERLQKWDEAESLYKKMSDRYSGELEIHRRLARIYVTLGRLDEAKSELRQVLARYPGNQGTKKELGSILEQQQRWSEAEAMYQDMLSSDPQNEVLQLQLARLYARTQRVKEALQGYEKIFTRRPTHTETALEFANFLRDVKHDPVRSEKIYKAIIRRDLTQIKARLELVTLLKQQGRFDEAFSVINESPAHESVYLKKAHLFNLQGRGTDAAREYYEYLQLKPHDNVARLEYARLQVVLREWDEAQRAYGEAIREEPANIQVYLEWASALEKQDRFTEALSIYEQALSKAPDYVPTHLEKARIEEILGRYDIALKSYAEVLQLDPLSVDAKTGQWFCHYRLGHKKEVETMFERIKGIVSKQIDSAVEKWRQARFQAYRRYSESSR